ncbi:hypothetical protein TSOC_004485 [Tetrabaena socialis]|uniref:Uncharacterized protein n=1 Tax=Tetrabaena socialis TaxID=47790 RepID=A0A2J8A8S2_9CHLO|nr:hypothetical protein TSOC_004485 [Tetrabaena socialis]|eukprot:PNH08934.1 hypothetical protein TSOC_004485 [Tetrabaena socialis]
MRESQDAKKREKHGGLLDAPQPTGASWLMVVVLCGLVAVICSIDRTAMSGVGPAQTVSD